MRIFANAGVGIPYDVWANCGIMPNTRIMGLKALPPVCMKYTARGESRAANIVRGKA